MRPKSHDFSDREICDFCDSKIARRREVHLSPIIARGGSLPQMSHATDFLYNPNRHGSGYSGWDIVLRQGHFRNQIIEERQDTDDTDSAARRNMSSCISVSNEYSLLTAAQALARIQQRQFRTGSRWASFRLASTAIRWCDSSISS